MRNLWQDVRFAARMLWKNKGITAVAVVALALGVGANTAIFSVVNAVLLKPLPYKDPVRLVRLSEDSERMPLLSVSYPDFLDWRAQQTVFEGMALTQLSSYNLSGIEEAERLQGRNVSPEFFSVIGVEPALGRAFTEEENAPGKGRVVVLSHGLWQRRFGGDKDILGRAITLNGEPYTVIGVMPPNFLYGTPTDVFVPVGTIVNEMVLSRGNHPGLYVLARLKQGVTMERASEEMRTIASRLAAQYPDSNSGNTVLVQSLDEFFVSGIRPMLLILLGAVGFVLLIACANVANLLLARAASRGREIAIRMALGAQPRDVLRMIVGQGMLLTLAGLALGLLGAFALTRLMSSLLYGVSATDPLIFLTIPFALAAVALVANLVPARRAMRVDPMIALRYE
jgi:putative ABC transport system permease protein